MCRLFCKLCKLIGTLWCLLYQKLPWILELTLPTSHISITMMFPLDVLFVFSCAFCNRRLTVGVLVRVQHKYCMKSSECVELEEDFLFSCILCIGDILYFLTAFKKYVYHCFIFVTNTTGDKLFFSTCFCVPIHPQFPELCNYGLQTIKCIDKPETREADLRHSSQTWVK